VRPRRSIARHRLSLTGNRSPALANPWWQAQGGGPGAGAAGKSMNPGASVLQCRKWGRFTCRTAMGTGARETILGLVLAMPRPRLPGISAFCRRNQRLEPDGPLGATWPWGRPCDGRADPDGICPCVALPKSVLCGPGLGLCRDGILARDPIHKEGPTKPMPVPQVWLSV
jgi:hypothetical protein